MKLEDDMFRAIAIICFVMFTGFSGFIATQCLKISTIETKVDMIIPFVDMARDNREQILILKASQPQKKGLVTIKNSESLLNYTDPINMVYIGNKRVDKLVQQDIIKHY